MTITLSRRFVALAFLAVLVGGLAADCGGEGGLYQGGGDSQPHHRR